MRAAELGDDASARRALQESELEQVRLVDVLDRLRLLAERDRERREADRAAAELLDDARRSVAVEPLEPRLVDLEQRERLLGDRGRDAPSWRTSATSRTRRRMRFAIRGVPRERARSRSAASSSTSTPRMRAQRRTIAPSSSGV